MGVARLKKAELYYHKSVHEQIAAVLQETGACQIISTTEENQPRPHEVEALLANIDDKLSDVRYLTRTLTPHYVDPIPALDRMLGERPEATMAELEELASATDLKTVCENTRAVEHETGEVRLKLSEARLNTSILSSLGFFPYPLSVVTEGTRTVTALIGTLKAENVSGLRAALGDLSQFSQDTELLIAPFDEKDKQAEVYAALIYSRSVEADVKEACAKCGVSLVEIPASFTGTVDEEREKYTEAAKELEAREASLSAKMSALAEANVPTVQKLSDYYNSMSTRYNGTARSEETESTMLTKFWFPADKAGDIQEKINAIGTDIELVVSFTPQQRGHSEAVQHTHGALLIADIQGDRPDTVTCAVFLDIFRNVLRRRGICTCSFRDDTLRFQEVQEDSTGRKGIHKAVPVLFGVDVHLRHNFRLVLRELHRLIPSPVSPAEECVNAC